MFESCELKGQAQVSRSNSDSATDTGPNRNICQPTTTSRISKIIAQATAIKRAIDSQSRVQPCTTCPARPQRPCPLPTTVPASPNDAWAPPAQAHMTVHRVLAASHSLTGRRCGFGNFEVASRPPARDERQGPLKLWGNFVQIPRLSEGPRGSEEGT